MSLFLPSNLSPNFEEIIPNYIDPVTNEASDGVNIDFEFQVNTNGSLVRSYKLEILNDKNDADVPEDNVLATFDGVFTDANGNSRPLYNKDIHVITLSHQEIQDKVKLEIPKDYRWRIRLYEDEIYDSNGNVNIQTVYGNTYVGAGRTVGSTKNVIWLNKSNDKIIEDKYIQTTLYSDDSNNDFNPFNTANLLKNEDYKNYFDSKQIQIGVFLTSHINSDGKIDGFEIDQNDILPEYRKKISDGNMYFMATDVNSNGLPYNTCDLPKRIVGFENTDDDSLTTNCIIKIDPLQAYVDYGVGTFNESTYRLIYIQRQQIYSIDNSIGSHQLTKITLDEPLNYNTFHKQPVETGLVSDDFDYGRVYINPVKEFDSKSKLVPSAYINIAYSDDQLIDTDAVTVDTNYLSNYSDSLACVQLTNYVSKTGECSLLSDLKFKPDRHYMYQIFVIDQDAPNYDPADSVNPYKFYAGTSFNGNIVTDRYYLGGYNGDLTADLSIRDNLVQIYSNHQIGNTNQFICFIQPNNSIYEDEYKPCMLQLYNNKCQYDLYITNYNGNNKYNKDYSIDTLDDSQWLVTLTYPDDISSLEPYDNIINLINKPQTKYKIYSNFVNSIPEAYFYYRSDKTLKFNYYNFYNKNGEPLMINFYNERKIIPQRDVYVKCSIYDSNDKNKQKNFVTIKYYKYKIAEAKIDDEKFVGNIIYESDYLYDGKFEYAIKGLRNIFDEHNEIVADPQLYRIEIMAEDEHGHRYYMSEDVYFGYEQDIVNDRISADIDCEKQAIHVDFAPVKTFRGEGSIQGVGDGDYVSIDNELEFRSLQDVAGNEISIPEDFVFYTKLKIADDMFDKEAEQDVFSIVDDNNNEYRVTFDTRVYIEGIDGNKTQINSDYLSFRLYKAGAAVGDSLNIDEIYVQSNSFSKPDKFEYMINTSKNDKGIYMIEESTYVQSVDELQVNDTLKDNNNNYLIGPYGNINIGRYHVYDNNGSDINASNKDKMDFLYFKLTPESMIISTNNIE